MVRFRKKSYRFVAAQQCMCLHSIDILQRLSAQTNIPQKCFTLTISPTGFQFGFASSRSFTKSRKLLALPRSLQSPTIGPRYMSSVIVLPSIAVGVDSAHGTILAIRSGVRSHLTVQCATCLKRRPQDDLIKCQCRKWRQVCNAGTYQIIELLASAAEMPK